MRREGRGRRIEIEFKNGRGVTMIDRVKKTRGKIWGDQGNMWIRLSKQKKQ